MLRLKVSCVQKVFYLPVLEVIIEIYHDGNKVNEILSYKTIGLMVELIDKLVQECQGKFFETLPKEKAKAKNANMTAIMTIGFNDTEKMLVFEQKLKNIQN